MIKVSNTLNVCEVDGEESRAVDGPTLNVESHWNLNTLVVLDVGGKKFTVGADDLIAAVANAMRTGR